jgi:hypothetical protein
VTAATTFPEDPDASESGSAFNAAGTNWGVHVLPPVELWAKGENCSSWLGRNPTTAEAAAAAVTSPPLSATPVGVTTDQCDTPGTA